MKRRLSALLLLFVFVVAACGSSGRPETFAEQPGPLNVEWAAALEPGADVNAVPLAQRNFLEGCITSDPELRFNEAPIETQGLVLVCGCGYNGIVQKLLNDADNGVRNDDEVEREAFKTFSDLNGKLGDGDELPTAIFEIFEECITSEAGNISIDES